ncbi:MAG: hybrid sensor histidine kinase/response regulator [Syntrophorhabdaceae bacterium]
MSQNILVIDDQLENLQLLTKMLEKQGYTVRPVTNGKMALMAAELEPPDLVLLDINMPGMDGYQVCQQFKQIEKLKDIPVIFLTASDQTLDKVRAFNTGGVDYITKPFQLEEVRARISTHLTISCQKKILEHKAGQLQEGYSKLQSAEKLRDDLTHMVVHDVRNILQIICGYLDILRLLDERLSPDQRQSYVQQAREATEDLTKMVNSLLDINQMETGALKLNPVACEVQELLDRAVKQVEGMRGSRDIRVHVPSYKVNTICDPDLTARILLNLLHNAIKFTAENGSILTGYEKVDHMVRIYVRDDGPGIPPQFHAKVFEKFGRYDHGRSGGGKIKSTGLGLAFCKLGTEVQGGKIAVESSEGQGSEFWFMLPACND